MRLTADSYFTIGAAHLTAGKPPQDYAMTGVDGDSAIAVVSDGCSTGGRTDVGARIVALTTIQAASISPLDVNGLRHLSILQARDTLGLDNSDLLATCLFISGALDGLLCCLQGDGVIAVKYRSGRICMTRYDWLLNTPFYPAYSTTGTARFIEVHGGDISAHRVSADICFVDPGDTPHDLRNNYTGTYSLGMGMAGIKSVYRNLSEIEFAAVFSDGVTQIDNVDWKDAVVELMSFKATGGEFVKRRAMAAIRRWRGVGKGPVDDFSMAAIRVEHEE